MKSGWVWCGGGVGNGKLTARSRVQCRECCRIQRTGPPPDGCLRFEGFIYVCAVEETLSGRRQRRGAEFMCLLRV
jgi:hypothetical protein